MVAEGELLRRGYTRELGARVKGALIICAVIPSTEAGNSFYKGWRWLSCKQAMC
jgi:hypothetical protein